MALALAGRQPHGSYSISSAEVKQSWLDEGEVEQVELGLGQRAFRQAGGSNLMMSRLLIGRKSLTPAALKAIACFMPSAV
jgi:hypothetical protein